MKRGPAHAVLAAAVSAILVVSCGHHPKPGLTPALSQADQRLASGDYSGAFDAYADIVAKYPEEKDAARRFREAVERTLARANQKFGAKDYSAAESVYSALAASYSRFASFKEPVSFDRKFLGQRILECQENLSEPRARQALARGDYLRALDGFKTLPQATLRSPILSAGLRRIMEEVWVSAAQALARNDFSGAGKGYGLLWRDYSLAQQIDLNLPFSQKDVADRLETCRTELTREGLEQYRKGNLKEAIAVWRGLLEFDPENAEIRKAVETAGEQLKKLGKK